MLIIFLVHKYDIMNITIGAESGGAAGACAPPLFTLRPEIYSINCAYVSFWGENYTKFPVVHLHYLEHFGASGYFLIFLEEGK